MTELLLELDKQYVDELVSLEQLSFTYPWSREQLLSLLHQKQKTPFHCYGITEGKKLTGYLSFYELNEEIEILNLAVAQNFRRCGYASKLLMALFSRARKNRIESIILEVSSSNYPALALYKKFSFQEAGIRHAYYQDSGEDALIMRAFFNHQPGETHAFS